MVHFTVVRLNHTLRYSTANTIGMTAELQDPQENVTMDGKMLNQ